MKTYRDLIVWQKAIDLVCLTYKLTSVFPPEEIYSLTSQVKRSSISILSNIAEGYGRNSKTIISDFCKLHQVLCMSFRPNSKLQKAQLLFH